MSSYITLWSCTFFRSRSFTPLSTVFVITKFVFSQLRSQQSTALCSTIRNQKRIFKAVHVPVSYREKSVRKLKTENR